MVLCVLSANFGTPTRAKKFRSAEASPAGLPCLDNRIGGGRILKTGPAVANRAVNILRLAANSLGRAEAKVIMRRFKGRLGKAEGIVAAAHKLARIIWSMLVSGQPFDEDKAFKLTAASTARRLKHLQNQAQSLGMTLVPA